MSLKHTISAVVVTAALSASAVLIGVGPVSADPTPTATPAPSLTSVPTSTPTPTAPTPTVTGAPSAPKAHSAHPQSIVSPGVPGLGDTWATAEAVHPSPSFLLNSFDTKDATTETGENRSLGALSDYKIFNTIWASWTAPATGVLEADTLNTPNDHYTTLGATDTTLAVYSGSKLSTAKRLAYNDDSNPGTNNFSQVSGVPVTAGGKYHFQVGISDGLTASVTSANAKAGYVSLVVRVKYKAPSNDAFGASTSESGSSWTAKGTTVGATVDQGEDTVNPNDATKPIVDSIWYKWTPTASGTISMTSSPTLSAYQNGGEAYIAIWRLGPDGTFTRQSFAIDNGSATSLAIDGQSTYYFQVGEVTDTNYGADNLDVEGAPQSFHVTATYTGPVVGKLSSTKGSHAGGQTITVTGTRLGAVTQACFGPDFCTPNVNVVSSTKVTVLVPAVPVGTYPLWLSTGTLYSKLTSSANYTFK